jgi:hypothetical protein
MLMAEVYQLFPRTQSLDDQPGYGFTPQEVLFCVSTTLGRQLMMPMAEQAVISFGLSDEDDGWLCSSNILRRQVGWVDTSPFFMLEKNADGFRAKFSLERRGAEQTFEQKSLTSIFEKRQRRSTFNMSYLIFMHHQHAATRIFEQMNNDLDEYDRPVVWWQRTGGYDLDLDYEFLANMQSHVNEASVAASEDLRAIETERLLNGR